MSETFESGIQDCLGGSIDDRIHAGIHDGIHDWGRRGGKRGDFTIAGAEASYAPDLALEPIHLSIALRFDLEEERAEGRVRTRVRCNRAGSRRLALNAVDLDIESVDGAGWRYDGERIHLTWEEPFAAGEEREVDVRYAVESPISGMHFGHPDDAYPDAPLFVATDHETERARYWLPCVDYPTVRTSLEFELTAGEGLTTLANGSHQGDTSNGDGTITSRWRLDQPCPSYLCCIAVGRFTRVDDRDGDGIPIAYFASDKYTPEMLKLGFGRTPEMLEWIQKRLDAPFPYPKYFQIAVPGIGGAMENISLTTWDDLFVVNEELAGEWGQRVDAVNLHEMSHSYFGDSIVCRHFEHTWLKESWAVYMETVYLEETAGRDEADYDLQANADGYMREVAERYARPIVTRTFNSSWDIFDQHTYPGGAWRIHMLRRIVGDHAFWAATRDYVKTYTGKTVETEDFRRKLEEHSGLNLNRFFDQWVYGKGHPRLRIEYSFDSEKSECTFRVRQTQKDEKKGIGLFDFPLEIEVTDDEGARTWSIKVGEESNTLVVPAGNKPTLIRIDPTRNVLFSLEFKPGDDLLRAALTGAADIGNRIHAARTLIESGRRRNLEAVRDAMAGEPFWGVRVAVAQALGRAHTGEAIPILAALLSSEQDPRVVRHMATACGSMRDPRLRDALVAFLEKNTLLVARAVALESLGNQRDEDDLARLTDAADDHGIHHLVASGAVRGIGNLRSREAFDWLAGRLAYGELPAPVRTAATQAFAACGRRQERNLREAAAEVLIDLTRDPTERVRMGAAAGLAGLGFQAATPALESLKTRQPAQDSPRIQRWIDALSKGPKGEEAVKLQDRVEKLEERLRDLDSRVQTVEAQEAREKDAEA